MLEIPWALPWEPVLDERVIRALQKELALEVGSEHPLRGMEAKVIGRRVDNDDILVQLSQGRLARVHLGWPKSIEHIQNTKELPWTEIYATTAEFISRMVKDSKDYIS